DAFAQASVLTLYDPDRSQTTTYVGRPRSFDDLILQWKPIRDQRGRGLRILTETITSQTLVGQLQALLRQLPEARWHVHERAVGEPAGEGARLGLGRVVNAYCDLSKADLIVALDADFLSCGPAHLRYVRDFTARRREPSDPGKMNRLYAVEPTPT